MALLDALGLDDFDLGGYSLGARTALRMQIRVARPARAVIAGMGMTGLEEPHSGREDRYRLVLGNLGTFEEGTLEWMAERHLRAIGGDGESLLRVLDSPLLPDASFDFVPGSHTRAINRPEVGDAILRHLGPAAP